MYMLDYNLLYGLFSHTYIQRVLFPCELLEILGVGNWVYICRKESRGGVGMDRNSSDLTTSKHSDQK